MSSTHLSFYKLNSKAGAYNLYNDLTSTARFENSFSMYILDRQLELGESFDLTYDQVIESILCGFDQISSDELWEIVAWYENIVYGNVFGTNTDRKIKQEILDTILKKSGIEALYESGSSTTNWSLMSQFNKFHRYHPLYSPRDEIGDGSNMNACDFIFFLEYIILLMDKTNDAGLDDVSDYAVDFSVSEITEIERIKHNYQHDIKLHEFINTAFEEIKEEWISYNADRETTDLQHRYPPVASIVYYVYHFLKVSLEMIKSISEEDKNIVMIHGY